jgi:translation initiation factor 1 (eIF-1/SUI1)
MDIKKTEIHIRIKKRNMNKCWTIIENIDKIKEKDTTHKDLTDEKFAEVLVKNLQKICSCRGFVEQDDNKTTIKFQGTHSDKLKDYLIKTYKFSADDVKLHG